MVRQRITTNYCLKELLKDWMTEHKKYESAAWNNLVSFHWIKKQVWSINRLLFLTVKLSGKNKAMKQDFFVRIPMEECHLNAQFLCMYKKCSIYPHFLHLWTVLKIISNHYFPARTHLLEKLATFSWMTKPQKRRTDLFQYLCSILQNDKDTKKKNFWLKKLVPLY